MILSIKIYNSRYFLLCLIFLCIVSCEDAESISMTEEQEANLDIMNQDWYWPVNQNEQSLTYPFQGQLVVSARPHRSSSFSATTALSEIGLIPKNISILLPSNQQLSGSISIALDAVSEATSISTQAWLRSKKLWGSNHDIIDDENPFSSAQLLFSTNTQYSTFQGLLVDKTFDLYVKPTALPPFLFRQIPTPRFDLQLPALNNLRGLSVKVWQNLDELQKLSKARISLWQDSQLVSTLAETNIEGEAKLDIWSELFNSNQEQTFTLLISPSEESDVPELFKQIKLEDLLSGEIEVALPQIGELVDVSVNIENTSTLTNDPNLEVWQIMVKQAWGSQIYQDFTHPNLFEDLQGNATWQKRIGIRPSLPRTIPFYGNTPATLFIHPPTNSSQRTQRIEVSTLSVVNSLDLLSLPKPQVRGQVRDLRGQSIESMVHFTQLAWPWIDAKDLPLGQFFTHTDGQGGFSIAVDPGVYAVTYVPNNKELAARMILLKVPESEGLFIASQQALISNGEEHTLRTAVNNGGVEPIETQINIACLINKGNPILLGTSIRPLQGETFKVSLYQDHIYHKETYYFRLNSNSCPPWITEAETN